MRAIIIVLTLLTITSLLNTSCSNSMKVNENGVWRLINPDTLSMDGVFWLDYYNEDVVGPRFWQLEFVDTIVVEYRSHGFNVLHKTHVDFEINKDTLMLFYPRDYQYDHFNNTGEYTRLRTEKWLMHENNDTLTLTLSSVIDAYSYREYFGDGSIVYRFVKPSDWHAFPDYLVPAPTNEKEIIEIIDNFYSENGKKRLLEYHDSIPEEDNRVSFGFYREMIISDLNKLFDIQNNATLKQLLNYNHPEVLVDRALSIYLDYLKHGESYVNGDE